MKKPLRRSKYTNQMAYVVWRQQKKGGVPSSVDPVEPPTTSTANLTPEQEGLTDAGGGTDGGNGGSIQPAALEGNSIEYMGSDGADLFVIDFGSSFIADVITVTLAGIGVLECVWNAVTSRFECVFAGIAAALVLSIGIEIEVTFVY